MPEIAFADTSIVRLYNFRAAYRYVHAYVSRESSPIRCLSPVVSPVAAARDIYSMQIYV